MNLIASKTLNRLINEVLSPMHLAVTDLEKDPDLNASEYEAHSFRINSRRVQFRVGKNTGGRPGRFVTFQKKGPKYRPGKIKSKNMPFTAQDLIDYLLVWVESDTAQAGLFIFDKETLIEKRVLTSEKGNGKLSFRVFPPWETDLSDLGKVTQRWQVERYIAITDVHRIRKILLNLN